MHVAQCSSGQRDVSCEDGLVTECRLYLGHNVAQQKQLRVYCVLSASLGTSNFSADTSKQIYKQELCFRLETLGRLSDTDVTLLIFSVQRMFSSEKWAETHGAS